MFISQEKLKKILELSYDEGFGGHKEQKEAIIEKIIDELESEDKIKRDDDLKQQSNMRTYTPQ